MPPSEAARADTTWPAAYAGGGQEGTPWWRERRERARAAFETLPMPTWRRGRGWSLQPEPLRLEAFAPVAAPPAPFPEASGQEAHVLLVDGRLARPAAGLPPGVEVIPLGPGGPDLLPTAAADVLGAVVGPEAGKLEALNLAAMTGGALVRVARGARVGTLRLRHVVRTDGAAALPRLAVVLEEGAEATVLEECVDASGGGARALVDGVSEVVVGEGARLRYVDVTEMGPLAKAVVRRRARLGRDSRLEWTTGVFGGGFLALAWDTELVAPGARLDATGVYLSGGREQHALVSDTWHRAPATEADVQFRGAVFDRSASVFDGIIRTEAKARGTVSHLGDHLLFLSPHAHADSIPALLIEGDDVRVGHGATIGRVDPEQLYYLAARGIDPAEGREMLVLGYFEPTLERIPDSAVREAQRASILRRVRATGGETA